MAMLPPLPGGDWRGEECAHIDRLRTACKNTEHWELESSRTDAGDPWCLIYDRHQHRIVLHFARIDRRYVIAWPQLKRSASGATIAAGMRVHRIAREMMTDLGASSKLNALAPMAQALFRSASVPRRLMPAAIALGTSTFTMSALPGTPAIQNAIPMPFFGTTPFAAPGLGIIASAIMLGFGMWWLTRAQARAQRAGEGFGDDAFVAVEEAAADEIVRERATTAREFDPAEIRHGRQSDKPPPIMLAALPLIVVIFVNLIMSLFVLPGSTSRSSPKIDGRHVAVRRRRCVGGHHGAGRRYRDAGRHQLLAPPGTARQHGRRCERVGAARARRRESGGFWGGRGLAAGF